MNQLSFTKGYTPNQWVFGTNPDDHTKITSDSFNPAIHHAVLTEQSYHDDLLRRHAAKTAFLKADACQRIRRALLRRHRELDMVLAVGQKCFYWRLANAPRQQQNKWRGPATVVMEEQDSSHKVQTYWLVHETSLIRCAQQHVRPIFDSEPEDLRVNIDQAKDLSLIHI